MRRSPPIAQPCPLDFHCEVVGPSAHSSVAMNKMPDSGAPCLEPLGTGTGCSVVHP